MPVVKLMARKTLFAVSAMYKILEVVLSASPWGALRRALAAGHLSQPKPNAGPPAIVVTMPVVALSTRTCWKPPET